MGSKAGNLKWLLMASLVLAIVVEALSWRVPTLLGASERRLYSQCRHVNKAMDAASAVAIFSEYDTAYRDDDANNPRLVFQTGKARCVLHLDGGSGRITEAEAARIVPEFGENEHYQQYP